MFEYVVSCMEQKAAYKYFIDRQLNWMLHANYNDCRVFLVRTGVFPSHLLTGDEQAAAEVESAPALSTMSYEQRQALRKKLASLRPEPEEV